MCENEWRAEHCPDYGYSYCTCSIEVEVCEGEWDCEMIEAVMYETLATLDTNGDNVINPEDVIEEEHYTLLLDGCDSNNDGTIDTCELHACIVDIENAWRAEYCPDYASAVCPCPVPPIENCDGAWNCDDIIFHTEEVMSVLDSN